MELFYNPVGVSPYDDLASAGRTAHAESSSTETNGIGIDHRRANSIRASPCVLRRDMLKYLYTNVPVADILHA
jgi:hypothetical protein